MSVSKTILNFRERWKDLLDKAIISPVIRWNNTKYNEEIWSLGKWYTLKVQGIKNISNCGDSFSLIKAVDKIGNMYSLQLYPHEVEFGSIISFFGTKFGGNAGEIWLKVPDNFQIVDNVELTENNSSIDAIIEEDKIIVVEGNFGFIVNDYSKLTEEFINEYGDDLIIDNTTSTILSRGMFLIKNSLIYFKDIEKPNYKELFGKWHPIKRKNNRITEADSSKIKLFDRRNNSLAFETSFLYTLNKETTYGMPTIDFCYEYDKEVKRQLENKGYNPFYYFYTIKENNKEILVRIKDEYNKYKIKGRLTGDIFSTIKNQDIYREISSYDHSFVNENVAYLKDGTKLVYNKELNVWTTTFKETFKFNRPFAYNSIEDISKDIEEE